MERNSQNEYEVMLNLRKSDGISFDKFYLKYGISFDECFEYSWLVKNNLLVF